MNKKYRKHLGISLDLSIYHPRKNITAKQLEVFSNKIIKLVEKNDWYVGGGWGLVDLNKSGLPYIMVTPKHIIKKDLDE